MRALLLAAVPFCFSTFAGIWNEANAAEKPTSKEQIASPAADSAKATSQPEGYDWPRWRGPTGDGISRETEWIARWPAGGPPVVWKAKVGVGFSSTAIADGRLYIMGNRDGREVVSCLDASSGQPLWKHDDACALITKQDSGGPGSTPTVQGDRVYTFGRRGQFSCFNSRSGKVIWTVPVPETFKTRPPYWGCACSPLVVGKQVIFDMGKSYALDAESGQLIWQSKKDRSGYGTPVLFRSRDEMRLAVLNSSALVIRKVKDGTEVARFPWFAQFGTNCTTPVVSNEKIFFSTDGLGCALLKHDGQRLEKIYSHLEMSSEMCTSILWEGHLYGISGSSRSNRLARLMCLDFATGEVCWTQRGFGVGNLTLANGILILLSDSGELITAKANPKEYREISRAKILEGRCWTVPVLSHGRIYCRNDDGDLACVETRFSTAKGAN